MPRRTKRRPLLEKSNPEKLEEKNSTSNPGEGPRSPSPVCVSGSPPVERERGIDRASEYMSRLSSLRVATMIETINQARPDKPISKGFFIDAMVNDTWREFVKHEAENLKGGKGGKDGHE